MRPRDKDKVARTAGDSRWRQPGRAFGLGFPLLS